MEFDIQYLLLLQELRNATGGIFDEFFNALSKLSVELLPLLPFIIFWAVDKKWAYRFFATFTISELINGTLKLTFCAYRPWIRSDLIEPAGDSKVAATGYSFPSGHSTAATSGYGTAFVWQKDKRRWLAVLCAVLLVLTCFSRNFLGVHTPQDVVVGFSATAIVIFIVGIVQNKIGDNEKLIDILSLCGIGVVVLVIIYITFKPYPMDYVDGALLVDPKAMMNDTFKACGKFLGFILGSYIDRHYIKYEIQEGSSVLPLMTALGLGILYAWTRWFGAATIVLMFGGHWGNLLSACMFYIIGMNIWPLVIRKIK